MMDYLKVHFGVESERACEKAIVSGPQSRFTVLTPRLIRMEYDPVELFEDRPSQVFWYRNQPVPEFSAAVDEKKIEIETEYLQLTYEFSPQGFTRDSLGIYLKDSGTFWRYGDEDDDGNLLGTIRTLDGVDGAIDLNKGLLSRSGWALVDDSNTLVFGESHWVERRPPENSRLPGRKDLYFFAYGHDYIGCLQDFCKISGQVPMVPRWAFGNWWSRYWPYHQDELRDLMVEFEKHGIPLSVCIIDMDWHVVRNEYTNGWTGYTWNRELFPQPYQFIEWLHKKGLRTALNLHPADGVHPHEQQYEEVARFVGIDPDSKKPVPFDISNPRFVEAYFELLHHPMEKSGVDFWWMDWQQGTTSRMKGLDPLWALNHLHFVDSGRDGNKRPFIFSRWAGLGGHRYPIGFSGDTIVSWASLDFQPYFTATASNVAYGWWSHDIGGHMHGCEDPELYARWVQWGVFSPIMRLHSTSDPYIDRRPWGHGEDVGAVVGEVMRLRHALIPYIYTMSWRNHRESIPLITPMYYHHAEREEAYCCPNQYYFGSELVVAPFTSPREPDTRLSRKVAWLPEGDWFDFWTGRYYAGNSWHALYGGLGDIPVMVKAGSIVPLGKRVTWGGIDNPEELEIHVFPGADGEFALYEDDGESQFYRAGHYAITRFSLRCYGDRMTFSIDRVLGDQKQVPRHRQYDVVIKSVREPDKVWFTVNGAPRNYEYTYDEETATLLVTLTDIGPDDEVEVHVLSDSNTLLRKEERREATIKSLLKAFKMPTRAKALIEKALTEQDGSIPDKVRQFTSVLTDNQIRAIIETLCGTGVERVILGGDRIILWNNQQMDGANWQFSAWQPDKGTADHGQIPRFLQVDRKLWEDSTWRFKASFFNLVSVTYQSK